MNKKKPIRSRKYRGTRISGVKSNVNVPRGTYKNLAITTADDVQVGNFNSIRVRGSLAKNPNPIASENINSTSNSSAKGPIDLKIKKDSKLKRYPK